MRLLQTGTTYRREGPAKEQSGSSPRAEQAMTVMTHAEQSPESYLVSAHQNIVVAVRSDPSLELRPSTLGLDHACVCIAKWQKPLQPTARPLSGGLLQRTFSVCAQKTCQRVEMTDLPL